MLQSSWKTLSLPHSPPSWQPRERERERKRDDCLLKSYSERIQSLDFPRTRDATSLSAESGCEVEELSRARERDPRECPQTPEKLSIRRACPLGFLPTALSQRIPRRESFGILYL